MTPGGTKTGAEAPTPGLPETAGEPRPASALSPVAWIAGTLGMILCVGVADFLTGTDYGLTLFYLAPIGFGTWFVSLRGGIFLAAASAAVSVAADAFHRLHAGLAELPVSVLAWNGLMQLGTSSALVLVLGALRTRLEGEELLARTDSLTHIANRRAFFEAAAFEIERARRHGRPLTLAYVDCDDFKDVNDLLGHAQGDLLLVTVAHVLRGRIRAVDAVARLGGDEFGLLFPETDALEADALLQRLQAALLSAMAAHGWNVGFSIGAATFASPPSSLDEMMARADALMYAAKREAKGSIRAGVFHGAPRDRGTAAPP